MRTPPSTVFMPARAEEEAQLAFRTLLWMNRTWRERLHTSRWLVSRLGAQSTGLHGLTSNTPTEAEA